MYCEIESPDNLQHPLLQRKVKTEDGVRTIAGLGKWSAWITSVEMDKAIQLGYKVKIIKGYRFRSALVFHEFIERLYLIRLSYPKTDPMNLIAKLIMNSVYGRLGMPSDQVKVVLFNSSLAVDRRKLVEIAKSELFSIANFTKIGDKYIAVEYRELSQISNNERPTSYFGTDINVAAAAVITGGARVHMSHFKNLDGVRLYYSDTDSVVLNKELHPDLVNDKLGGLKLEYEIDRAVFLSPKVYGLITTKGNTVLKIKGVSKKAIEAENIEFGDLVTLLEEGYFETYDQEKWFKKIYDGDITVKQVTYQLQVTNNKRAPIYEQLDDPSKTRIFSDTRPYRYEDLEKISTQVEAKERAVLKNLRFREYISKENEDSKTD